MPNIRTLKPREEIKEILEVKEHCWKPGDLRFLKIEDLAKDSMKLIQYIPPDCKGIVGTIRGGLIPATILAECMQLPLLGFSGSNLVPLTSAGRGRILPSNAKGKYFAVDDSVHQGFSVKRLRKLLGGNAVYAAVYVRPDSANLVDYYAEIVKWHFFEWNIFNNSTVNGGQQIPDMKGGIGFDWDGIFSPDVDYSKDARHIDENDEQVIEWIRNCKPRYIPRLSECPLVVSYRLERHRKHCEEWLSKWGIKVRNLVLFNGTFKERESWFSPAGIAKHKGEAFKNSHCKLFFESDSRQGQVISNTARKVVINPNNGDIFYPR